MPEVFTGVDFGFRRGASTALYQSSIRNGTFNLCTDTGDLYIDIDNKRIAVKDIISMPTENDILSLQNPYQRIYFALDTYNLWRYNEANTTWKQVSEHVKLADNASSATYATNAGTATADSGGNTINATYIKNASTASQTIIFTKGDNSTFSITVPETTSQEVADARIGVDGSTYSDLGTAIRTQISDLANGIINALSANY